MDILRNAYGNYKKANSLKNWGIFAMLLVACVVIICVPILTIFLGLAIIVTRVYDYKENIYELKTKRMLMLKGVELMQKENQKNLKKDEKDLSKN